jgi:cell division protein FtsB
MRRIGGRTLHRPKKKPFIPTLFQKIVFVIVVLVLVTILSWEFITIASRPYVLEAKESAILAQKKEQLKVLTEENEELARKTAYYSRPDGIESAARNLGYLKPGEQSIIIQTTPSSGATAQ